MRIAISTGGGDAPGLNAVIRAVVLSAHHRGWQSYGIQRGYEGLLTFNGVVPLGPAEVRGITHLGGTILGTTNRGNPFRYVMRDERRRRDARSTGRTIWWPHSRPAASTPSSPSAGTAASRSPTSLWQKGLPVVCVPKTIDNDVSGTQRTFGFDTAVSTATEAIDKLHSTAESHDRVMVVELMGRYAGWIALYSGLSGSADVILLPEIPFDIEKVCAKIRAARRPAGVSASWWWRKAPGPADGDIELVERRGVGTVDRLGGIASKVARAIEHRTGKETRTLVLGHLQRGGSPTTYDRLLALRFGAAAVRAIADGAFGTMVGLNGPTSGGCRSPKCVGQVEERAARLRTPSPRRASWGSAWVTDPSMPTYPVSRTCDAVEVLHGEDDSRSLPMARGRESARDQAWTDAQNALTDAYLDAVPGHASGSVTPPRPAARHRCAQRCRHRCAAATSTCGATGARTSRCCTCGKGFEVRIASSWIPNALDAAGTIALDWYYPARTALSWPTACPRTAASRASCILLDVDTGRHLPDRIPHTRAADARLASRHHAGSTTPAIPRRARCPTARSTITAPSTSIASAPIPPRIRWSSSRRRRSTGPVWDSRLTAAGC